MKGPTAVAVTAAAVALGAGTAGASSVVSPCWKSVQTDWYQHGRVVGHYKLACYLTAIKMLPADAATYGGVATDISRAYRNERTRLAALAKKKQLADLAKKKHLADVAKKKAAAKKKKKT